MEVPLKCMCNKPSIQRYLGAALKMNGVFIYSEYKVAFWSYFGCFFFCIFHK